MKQILIVVLVFITIAVSGQRIAQQTDYPPDSGFTNKAKAKNLKVNGIKEGKWIDTVYRYACFGPGKTLEGYELVIYKNGSPVGLIHKYDLNWRPETSFMQHWYWLNGTITDKETHKPIQGIKIRLACSDMTTDSTITNEEGNYFFDSTKILANSSFIVAIDASNQMYDSACKPCMNFPFSTIGVNGNLIFTRNWELDKKQ